VLLPGSGPTSAPAWVESPGGTSVTGHAQWADRLLIRSTRWAKPEPANPGTGQMKGTHNSGQIRSESPKITDTDPGDSPPRTAGNDTHRSVDTCRVVQRRPDRSASWHDYRPLVRISSSAWEIVRPDGSHVGSRRPRLSQSDTRQGWPRDPRIPVSRGTDARVGVNLSASSLPETAVVLLAEIRGRPLGL
jgi:hypothetical protein